MAPEASFRCSMVVAAVAALGVIAGGAITIAGAEGSSTRDPRAVAQYKEGTALAARDDHAGAIKAFSAAVGLEPQWVEARNDLGVELYLNGEPDRAAEELRSALVLDPAQGRVMANLGFALYDLGDVDGAVVQWRAALDHGARAADTYAGLALGLYKQGHVDEAVRTYRTAIERDKRYARADYLGSDGAGWSRHAVEDSAPLLRALGAPAPSPTDAD